MIYNKLQTFCEEQIAKFDSIDSERKEKLMKLAKYFSDTIAKGSVPSAIAICTHNSRRSHFAQIWLAVAAAYYKKELKTFSGGTEVTALNINVVDCLLNLGFQVVIGEEEENPKYQISWSEEVEPYEAFSKTYDNDINPKKEFAAIMVCNSADENCPVVFGSDIKIALPFDDPKAFDESEEKEEKYQQTCEIIALEMLYVMFNVGGLIDS